MRYAIGFFGAIALMIAVGLTLMYTGAYNVAATEPHAGVARWILDTTFHNSVRTRSDPTAREDRLIRPADLRTGFQEFQEYCVHCHGAPGVKPHEWVSGMTPNPPDLTRAAAYWSEDEIFWIIKHGVKMTGMPPFGDTESDETIRSIAAFVQELPNISPAQYARLRQRLSSGSGHGHQHSGAAPSAEAHGGNANEPATRTR